MEIRISLKQQQQQQQQPQQQPQPQPQQLPHIISGTRFRPWSPIATGNHLDRAEKIPDLLRRLTPLKFLIRVQAFRDPLRGELPHVQTFMNDGPNPLT